MEKKQIIEEVIIKKKKQGIDKQRTSERIKNELLSKKKRRENTHKYISAQSLVKNYRERQKSFSNYKRKQRSLSKITEMNYDSSKEHLPIIIIRICGQWSRIPKEIQSLLTKLNLMKLFTAVIVFYNKETLKLLQLIENYVTWGYISKTRIEEMIRKRGSVSFGTNEPNEYENDQIESSLGKYGIVCIEDIIHELSYETENAKAVLEFVGYFTLSVSEDGFPKANIPFMKGGNQGFRGDKINALLKKMI
jgi:large subunit ribosomal protein L7e